jgi:hypothetical protein
VAMQCFACGNAPRSVGLLCAACADGLVAADLCPEQIVARAATPMKGLHNAWLIDGFGVPHTLTVDDRAGASVSIGRARRNDVCVAERTVSQAHALLEHRAKSNVWFVLDTESENGTYVNDDRVERRFPLESGDELFVGRKVGFVFVPLDEDDLDRAHEALRWLKAQAPASIPTRADAGVDAGIALKVSAVTEGGAIAAWGDNRAQLSELEYELVTLLHGRFVAESALGVDVRGFVPAQLLLEKLSFVSEAPTHANLRGLVRKVRKKLAGGDPPLDVIESRKGLGYRLARLFTLA